MTMILIRKYCKTKLLKLDKNLEIYNTDYSILQKEK